MLPNVSTYPCQIRSIHSRNLILFGWVFCAGNYSTKCFNIVVPNVWPLKVMVSRTVIYYPLFMSTGKDFQVQAIYKYFQACKQHFYQNGGFETAAWNKILEEQIIFQGFKESEGSCSLKL